MRRSAALLMFALLGACGDPPARRAPPMARPADKAAMYGDPALIPTRSGERARAEVALAEEIRVALETLHEVESARVSVRTLDGETPHSAALVLRGHPGSSSLGLRARATRIAASILGSTRAELTVEVSVAQVEATQDDTPPRPLILVAVLGLGFFLGLTFDRMRRLVSRRQSRA